VSNITLNGKKLVAPKWKTGNEPEYSRADLHLLDAIFAGSSENAAKRPALIDIMATADRMVDNTLIARAFLAGVAGWEPFSSDTRKGELCCMGIRYTCHVTVDGLPSLDQWTRDVLKKALAKAEPQQ